ncbi:sugar phosphate isomerase/epimerase family protein [Lacticaseibacillus nasuensis]|uniref:Xylose isomerase-like TIM barrel domain-containing protein n=1 Tax=Lacticaseibacillus nasuensis JCM 17158 TaxID=1291734 RepID=A0A0R1JGR4_9LACO|nr:sugar phosphate isomerase/epimerase [Lacticaseibacillus nasuensis]KRK70398.1 hypothetical protein FD02_GL000463 [Lacticaseibacillus nasuensis JCM 17158]
MVAIEKIAAQMYSLRDELAADPENTFMTLHEIGYQAVQLDGMRGANPQVIAKLLKKYNLKVAGMHLHHERFFTDIDGLVQEALLFGSKILYDKYIDDDQQNDAGYRATRAQLYHVQDALRQLGFTIGLHSPESDYPDLVDGQRVLSYITQPQNGLSIVAEPDTYWITAAGIDPVEEIKQFSNRAPVLHLKDYKNGYRPSDPQDMSHNLVELGKGDVDLKAIVDWGEHNGVQYYAIEQDFSQIGMFSSMRESFEYLSNL